MGVEDIQPSPELKRSQVTLKTVFTVSAGAVLTIAVVLAVAHALVALTLTAIAILVSVALNHVVARLERRRVSRPSAVALVLTALFVLIGAASSILIPPAISQSTALVRQAPNLVMQLTRTQWFRYIDQQVHIGQRVAAWGADAPSMLAHLAGPLMSAVGSVLSSIVGVITVIVLTAFMLLFGPSLVTTALEQARPERRPRYTEMVENVYGSIGGYIIGLALICTINAALASVFLAINGIPFFLTLGIVSGFSSMIPYAGPFAAGVIISLISWASGGLWHGLASAIYFAVYGQIEGHILSPIIFRRTVHLNPLVVVLAVLYLAELGGIVGAVVAVPAAATLQVILHEVLRFRREQRKLLGQKA